MQVKRVHLPYRIPAIGAEFLAGQNCRTITATPMGYVIVGVRTESGDRLAWSLLCSAHGWAYTAEEGALTCSVCGQDFKTSQAMAAHMTYKHKEAK